MGEFSYIPHLGGWGLVTFPAAWGGSSVSPGQMPGLEWQEGGGIRGLLGKDKGSTTLQGASSFQQLPASAQSNIHIGPGPEARLTVLTDLTSDPWEEGEGEKEQASSAGTCD